ncbi:hypothetical protein PFICI_12705 [Pestalotiopsis fici W106-1]|uniref:Ricin B lectin domain-containing protein n=1 Tax=Pestalotiopsis fici (strain W106-1 / CGMCC3.15140) TaxID=1229662 RepID=W3WSG0_PESFW|nr:uncharacterized protein PFICI_12705 [Pestalotiopsis fici W106-1]ETS75761.1 hypothetical protein PFICI_12705 [Pestalotiopsis fici W106-1]
MHFATALLFATNLLGTVTAAPPTDGGLYSIVNLRTATVVDLESGRGGNNVIVQGWAPIWSEGAKNRIWRFVHKGKYWKLINLASGTALTLQNGASDNQTPIVGYVPYETDRQLWQLLEHTEPNLPRHFQFINKAGGTSMDLYFGGMGNGTRIYGYESFPGNVNQLWVLVPITPDQV